jgi:hypothetical protein
MKPRSATAEMQGLNFVYNHDDQKKDASKSIFTPARIQAMCKTEAIITKHPLYRIFCEVDETGVCVCVLCVCVCVSV